MPEQTKLGKNVKTQTFFVCLLFTRSTGSELFALSSLAALMFSAELSEKSKGWSSMFFCAILLSCYLPDCFCASSIRFLRFSKDSFSTESCFSASKRK